MNERGDSDLARRYLCGLLEDEDCGAVRDQIEERLLSDGGFAVLVEAVERELFDELAAGSLRGAEQLGFVRYVDSHPEARSRMQFAAALRRSSLWWLLPEWRTYFRDWHIAAAVALMVLGAGVALRLYWGAQVAPPRPKPEPAIFAFALVPGSLRSANPEEGGAPPRQAARIPATAVAVTIDLAGARVNPPQTARIFFVDTGQEVWKGAVREGRVRVPSSQLRAGDHVLTTIGAAGEEQADYVFRVMR